MPPSVITFEDAVRRVREYAEQNAAIAFSDDVVDRGAYWFFPVGSIGSCGVIVDKANGRLSVMGSALSLDDCFWGHEHGFSSERAVLRITRVHDVERTVELLFHAVHDGPPHQRNPDPRRAWMESRLQVLPCEFAPRSFWLRIPSFRAARREGWFDYEVVEPMEQDKRRAELLAIEAELSARLEAELEEVSLGRSSLFFFTPEHNPYNLPPETLPRSTVELSELAEAAIRLRQQLGEPVEYSVGRVFLAFLSHAAYRESPLGLGPAGLAKQLLEELRETVGRPARRGGGR